MAYILNLGETQFPPTTRKQTDLLKPDMATMWHYFLSLIKHTITNKGDEDEQKLQT